MDLAEASDVAAALGVAEGDLTPAQVLRIPPLLAKASYLFRIAAGRQFTPDTYTQRLKVNGGRVRLPESPITSVDSVVDDSGNQVTYTRDGAWLIVEGHHNHNNSFDGYQPSGGSDWFATVTYDGGEISDVVTAAVAQMVATTLQIDPAVATGAKRVENVAGPFQRRLEFFDGTTATVTLSDEDRELAESFRYPGTQVIVQRP